MTKKLLTILFALFVVAHAYSAEKPEKYNVLFIAVDDLNDWTGFLGGHPQTKTPAMDKLAAQGVVFTRAYCPASVCNPSRSALMTGIRPSSSGVYGNKNFFRNSTVLKDIQTIPQYLSEHGYFTMARGKIFHSPNGPWGDIQSWDLHVPTKGNYGKAPKKQGFLANGIPKGEADANFDWGPTDAKFEETPDYLNAKWAAEKLQEDYDKPFFLACGIFRPHLKWEIPKEFFDKFPEDEMILPEVNENDLDDTPKTAGGISRNYEAAKKYNKQKAAVQAYLACINYADSCIAVLLDALEKSKYRDNTIVILWGDHGWHLGEKLHYKKATLWEEACRVPLIIKAPGISTPNTICDETVNLLDLYPTIVELCDILKNGLNQGNSIVPLLKKPEMEWDYPALTTMGFNRHTLRTKEWRYTRYQDGSEELYNHREDPREWNNLAGDPKYKEVIQSMGKWLPKVNVPEIVRTRH